MSSLRDAERELETLLVKWQGLQHKMRVNERPMERYEAYHEAEALQERPKELHRQVRNMPGRGDQASQAQSSARRPCGAGTALAGVESVSGLNGPP